MTIKQRILKSIYPLLMLKGKLFSSAKEIEINKNNNKPDTGIYALEAFTTNGNIVSFDQFRGKKLVLVNTASDCGYTNQYDELEKLYQQYKGKVEIIAFPANDFAEQEKGSDEDINAFCKVNFGVTFPLMKKSKVTKGIGQNEIFGWLTNKEKNGWNDDGPEWNFTKFVIDEEGVLAARFAPGISPLHPKFVALLNK